MKLEQAQQEINRVQCREAIPTTPDMNMKLPPADAETIIECKIKARDSLRKTWCCFLSDGSECPLGKDAG
jgi:hypothetical protein